MEKEKFEYKISLLEMVGIMYTGVGIMMIVKSLKTEETYEALFWLSPNLEVTADRFVMPLNFLEKEGIVDIEKFSQHSQYKDFIIKALKILPKREIIFKEAEK